MSFFRRKSEKNKSTDSSKSTGLSRSSSLKNERSSNPVLPSTKLWKNNNDADLGVSARNGCIGGQLRPHTLLISTEDLRQKPVLPPDSLESPVRTTSRLSKTLREIIRDKDGLSCFIDFMKSEKAEHLIQFWCDAESFQAATLMRLRSHALQSVSKSAILKRRNKSKSESVSEESDATGDRHHSKDSENISSKSSNCDHHLVNATKEGSAQGPGQVPQPPDTGIDSSCGDVNIHTHSSSHLARVPDQAKYESFSDSNINSHQFNPPATSPFASSQNQNNIASEAKSEFMGKVSGVDHGLSPTVGGGSEFISTGERSAIFKEHYRIGEEAETGSKNEAASKSLHNDNSDKEDIQHGASEFEDLASKLRKSIERDAVTIFSNYIAKDAPKPIGVGDELRADAISKICREDGQVDPGCFTGCQEFVLTKIQSQYFQSFRDSALHSKHQINVLTSTTVYLPDILLAENALCYFLEYMEQEGAGDLMQLWLAVDNFQQQLTLAKEGYDWEQAQNDAMVIYDKYFSLQATNPMGFDDKLRFLIEENICREGGPMPDCFSEAKVIVLKTLDKMYFNNYLQSQVYYRYLSDLLSTVQMAEDMHHKPKGHRRSGSDASSEHSISSFQSSSDVGTPKPRNTLLAVDTRKGKKNTASSSSSSILSSSSASSSTTTAAASAAIEGDFSMTMDMFNPDDLWKRTSPGGMSLGSVDGLGQFVSNFESDGTDKRKGGGFLKRWKDKEKEQEEVALRIAQMIINDVNSMTQSSESLGDVLEEDEVDDKTRAAQGR